MTGKIFLTGATGYIGGRLAPRLLRAGYTLCCLARSAEKLRARPWADDPRVEIVEGSAEDVECLAKAMQGCTAAYYLVHSMVSAGERFREKDHLLASRFAEAAKRAGVERILYLGGLGEMGPGLSEHLASRREVETVLASFGVPVTCFRAAMIIGSGSSSFEILRYLVERLPIMVTPKWVRTECQPIAVTNVLHYLVACLECPETVGRDFDIGGTDVLTYEDLMQTMAEVAGLRRRLIVPVPVLTPRLSSLWIHLVTPIDGHMARPLAEGLRNRVVCRESEALRLMPQPLLGVREALQEAYGNRKDNQIETSWADAGEMPGDPDWAGGTVFEDRRSLVIPAPPERTFAAVMRMGGGTGYYAAGWLWKIRGWIDRLVGGPGLRRGRRDRETLRCGEALDFWRVSRFEIDRLLCLRAEMKLPGVASLEFEVQPGETPETSRIVQTARFRPRGLGGLIYWYGTVPFHFFVFRGMLLGIRDQAVAPTGSGTDEKPSPEVFPQP